MFKMLLSFLLVLSIGWADGKRDRSVVKKKVVMITSDDDQKNRSIEIEADVDDEILKLTITVNGDKKEFEVFNFPGPGVALSMYNLDQSIID